MPCGKPQATFMPHLVSLLQWATRAPQLHRPRGLRRTGGPHPCALVWAFVPLRSASSVSTAPASRLNSPSATPSCTWAFRTAGRGRRPGWTSISMWCFAVLFRAPLQARLQADDALGPFSLHQIKQRNFEANPQTLCRPFGPGPTRCQFRCDTQPSATPASAAAPASLETEPTGP